MNARDYALAMLDRTALPGWRKNLLHVKAQTPADPRDLALSEQIRVGVIKNHALLEHVLEHYAKKPDRIDPLVRKILIVGLYQLRFLDRIPASAAVDEAVEQARRFGRPHGAGFVNAVLRSASRSPEVPLPGRNAQPAAYAQIVLSHPADLVERLIAQFGADQAIAICEHDNMDPPIIVRAFRRSGFGERSAAEAVSDVQITPHERSGMFVVDGAKRAKLAEWSSAGVAQVQDPTASGVVEHLDLQPGQDVLDRCAGLGTKTLQIHDLLDESGWIMAIDPSEARCEGLRRLIKSRNIDKIAVIQASLLRQIPEVKRPAFDRILVDVPCSNSGVLARRAEARYAQTPAAMKSLIELQDQILDDTADYLRPGGMLVYSTCSVWPEENEQRIAGFLQRHSQYEQLDYRSTLPSMDRSPTRYHDGGFFAVVRRRD